MPFFFFPFSLLYSGLSFPPSRSTWEYRYIGPMCFWRVADQGAPCVGNSPGHAIRRRRAEPGHDEECAPGRHCHGLVGRKPLQYPPSATARTLPGPSPLLTFRPRNRASVLYSAFASMYPVADYQSTQSMSLGD